MESPRSIGQSAGHIEGPAKVTGRARYSADIALSGMLWGRTLRSSFPHARIVSIDLSAARRVPGVHAVISGADLPEVRIGRFLRDIPVLARDRVRFIGEKVVAVAAETPDAADEALSLIDVEYKELPAVFDPIEAMAPDAPRIHEHPERYEHPPIPPIGGESRYHPFANVCSQSIYRRGDLARGMATAERTFEHTFIVPPVHQGYIEPHACASAIGPDGKIDIWISNKTPFIARRQLAAAFGVAEDRVRVNPTSIGGDFGGKGSLMDAALCYFLARASQRPVKMVMNYTEELTAGNPRHAGVITMRTGVTREGTIVAHQAKLIFNCGAYGAFIPLHFLHGSVHSAAGPYRIPNVEIEALRVYTNTVPRGHFRSPGAPQTTFAVESHMDMIAREIGIDPLEFRLRNVLVEGDESAMGERFHHIRCRETLTAAADASKWNSPKPPNVGRGIGIYERAPGAFGTSGATLTLDRDSKLMLITGAADTGTGSFTVLAQVVAEELQAPLAEVIVCQGDTDTAEWEEGAGGSRLTHMAGRATLIAAGEMKRTLIELAARHFNCTPEQVRMRARRFIASDGRELDWESFVAWAAEHEALPLTRSGSYVAAGHPNVTCYVAQVAEVEVDRETGQVRVRKIVSAHDVGTVINPLTHQGQIEGGLVQGLGQAMSEHLLLRDGSVTTAHLGDYKLPTAMDIPELTTVLVESQTGPGPFAGKSIGELSNVPPPAAIANAVFDAVGVRLTDLPITAEKVYTGLRAMEKRD
jgi:CO/xanthine dehydrogenase Mo-binding subunit